MNRTSKFILPLTNIPLSLYKHRFINSVLYDKSFQIDMTNRIIIQLIQGNDIELIQNDTVIATYIKEIDEIHYDMIVVEIPTEYHNDYHKLIMGLYNEVSEKCKRTILDFPMNIAHKTSLTHTLNNNKLVNQLLKEFLKNTTTKHLEPEIDSIDDFVGSINEEILN